jgi:PEGA domain
MRQAILVAVSAAILATGSVSTGQAVDAAAPQAKPRQGQQQGQPTQPQGRRGAPPPQTSQPQQAKPREQPPPRATPRRTPPPPPPRVVPPHYFAMPHRYYFPPVSLQLGFYYHPYFGFYYGPYYGPYYAYPGPFAGQLRYAVSAVRTKVKPVETLVYVNGYYAGVVDDFDGLFQRLYLPAGAQEIEFRLDGYQSFRQALYLNAGDTREIAHQMRPLRPGEPIEPIAPRPVPGEWTDVGAPAGSEPASPYGILVLRVEPADAQVLVDGETWLATEDLTELVIHVPAGPHQVEIRKDGYRSFKTGIELSEGARTRLNVTLVR